MEAGCSIHQCPICHRARVRTRTRRVLRAPARRPLRPLCDTNPTRVIETASTATLQALPQRSDHELHANRAARHLSGVKATLQDMYGGACWHCRGRGLVEMAHMFAKADNTFATCQELGLVDPDRVSQAENALSLCP